MKRVYQILAGTAVAALMTGCPPADRTNSLPDDADLRGASVDPAYTKPPFTLTSQDGEPFDFVAETEGSVTLLFFGYTHCPDICPVHMANIAAAMNRLTPTQAQQIKVVFVTTDPARDTPDRLKEWLGAINPDFIGLTGTEEAINEVLRFMQMPEVNKQSVTEERYDVVHAAHVILYTPDNLGHLIYPFGIRQVDWVNDLNALTGG